MEECVAVIDQTNMTVLVIVTPYTRFELNLLDPSDVECWSKCLQKCRVLLKDSYKTEYFDTLFEMGLITPKNYEAALGIPAGPTMTIKQAYA